MDSDFCPADPSVSAPSEPLCFATVPVDGVSGVEITRQFVAAPPQVEDLESYNLIEPPPLDWRSDSSSESGSADDLADPSFPPSVENLDMASSSEPVLPPLNISDTVASLDARQKEVVGNFAEPVQDIKMEMKEEEDEAAEEEKGVRVEGVGEYQEQVTICDVKSRLSEEEVEGANRKSGDEDHKCIHSLLSQLQLTPPHPVQHQYCSLSELEACTPSLITDDTETTGLLFSESHHRDLLGLLQFTEISATSHPTCLPHRGEVDAVVSVSYNQEDAQRIWGHCENGQQQRHRDESVTSLPDDEYPEAVWKKRDEESPEEEEAAAEGEQVG